MKKKTTISDIAKEAGVSRTTVSGILNFPHRYNSQTVARVKCAMRELQYEPRKDKRREKREKDRCHEQAAMALLFPHEWDDTVFMSTPLSSGLIQGVEKVLTQHGKRMVVQSWKDMTRLPEILESNAVEGVIIRTTELIDYSILKSITIPIIFVLDIGYIPVGYESVGVDNDSVGRSAFEYLSSKQSDRYYALVDPKHRSMALRAHSFQFSSAYAGQPVTLIDLEEASTLHHYIRQDLQNDLKPGVFIAGHDQNVLEFHDMTKEMSQETMSRLEVVCCCSHRDLFQGRDVDFGTMVVPSVQVGMTAAKRLIGICEQNEYTAQRTLLPADLEGF